METAVTLEKFQGPLDLLLQLIEKEELPIAEISIAEVTDQYVRYLDTLEELFPEELADFLVIATKLLYLKSKTLLPYLYPEEDEGPSLAEQLKLYKRYSEASKIIGKMWENNLLAYGRTEPPVKMEEFVVPSNAQANNLLISFTNLLKRLKPVNPLPKLQIDSMVSIKERIVSIYEAVQKFRQLSFTNLLSDATNKTEIIINFLALLELVKTQKIFINQPTMFDDLHISIVTF
jgi:segregation and condensation protein A